MIEKPDYHIIIFINEELIFDYYVNYNFKSKKPSLINNNHLEQIFVNYNLQNKDKSCIRKIKGKSFLFYEINFEKAYEHLRHPEKNAYTNLESYLISLVQYVMKDSAKELVAFLTETKKVSSENILQIETNYNKQKKQQFRNRYLKKIS